ncbi:MAG: tetratricopeptide repeat protein [Candidatus Uhrbacteria bacterium]
MKTSDAVRPDLPGVVGYLMEKRLHPERYKTEFLCWEQLVAEPRWRRAKPLLKVDSNLVSSVVECLNEKDMTLRHNADAQMCLGKVRQFRGDYDGAIAVFQRMFEWDESLPALYNVGLCQLALGNADGARSSFKQVLSKSPHDERALRALAELPP